ncbi:MAG: glycosyltransferase family 1 protein [Planctomycetota bacterium]
MRVGLDLTGATTDTEVLRDLVRELSRLESGDPSVLDFVVFDSEDGALPSSSKVKVVPARCRRFGLDPIARLASAHEVDILHVLGLTPTRRDRPTIVSVDELSEFASPSFRRGRAAKRLAEEARSAEALLTSSQAVRGDILTWIPDVAPERIRVVSPGVRSLFDSTRRPDEETRLRKLYELPERFLFHESDGAPRRNLQLLSRVLYRLKNRGRVIPLVLAGDSKHYVKLRSLWNEFGLRHQIFELGDRPATQVADLYRMSAATVFPAQYTGPARQVLEAFATGTPVICSTRGALTEITGRAALTVCPEREDELSSAIERIWNDPGPLRELLSQRGVERAGSFPLAGRVSQMRELYLELSRSRREPLVRT